MLRDWAGHRAIEERLATWSQCPCCFRLRWNHLVAAGFRTDPPPKVANGSTVRIHKAPEGTWDVVDRFTGLLVTEDGVPLIDMPIEKADKFADLLNYRDRRQRGDT